MPRNKKRLYGPSDNLEALTSHMRSLASPLLAVLKELHQKYLPVTEGAVANYIPELAEANPNWFGICVVTVDGDIYTVGDISLDFTIQSIAKPFIYGLAIEDCGRESVLRRVGVEPVFEAFNTVSLDEDTNRPFNPMLNTGAIATTGLIQGVDQTARLNRLISTLSRYAGRTLHSDASVFTSERLTGHRNRAIAHLMLNFGMLDNRIDEILDLYFQQCSVLINCRDLATMAATLANNGTNPLTKQQAIQPEYVHDVLSVMFSCGMYDSSGEWAYRVGLPAKSGVGGGVIAVVPGECGIAVFSPPLDRRGNSVRGVSVCTELARHYGLHIFKLNTTLNQFRTDRLRRQPQESEYL